MNPKVTFALQEEATERTASLSPGATIRPIDRVSLYTTDPLRDKRWEELVASHPRSSIFHTPGWLTALSKTYDYEPVVFTTCSPGQRLANGIVFCSIRSWITGSRLVSLPFSDHCEPLVEGPDVLQAILNEVIHQQFQQGWDHVELRPLSSINQTAVAPVPFSPSTSFHLHALDLRPPLDEIFSRFDKDSVQRKIRRAEREGLSYQEGQSDELLAEFYSLLVLTRRRHHIPPQPIAWFRNLAQNMGDSFKARVASVGGRPIASIISLCHRGTMVYKYGCSDLQYSNLGGTALVFWHMIKDAKAAGCHTLDMGRSDNDNPGLIRFKSNWGASDSLLTYWRYPAAVAKQLGDRKRTIAGQIASRLPDRMFVALGKIVYRHIG